MAFIMINTKVIKVWIVAGFMFSILCTLSPTHVYGTVFFNDKTSETGLAYPLNSSFGLAWGDFDNDGYIDLYVKNHNTRPPSFYQNIGNSTFKEITDLAGLNILEDLHGACWADFDNDGDLDLYQTVGASGGFGIKANYLFLNNGDGTFTDIAGSAGIQDPKGRGRTPIWFDYNNDGQLDLYVANFWRLDAPSILFKNSGNGSFIDATEAAGLSDITSALGAYIADINGDALMDLILSDHNEIGIFVYLNNGDGSFRDFSTQSGLSTTPCVQDLAFGDYDNDGDIDVFACTGYNEYWQDAYETDIDRLYYRVTPKEGFEKGFTIEINQSTSAEFDLYVYKKQIEPHYIYIGRDGYHPVQVPFLLDAGSPENQVEPNRTNNGIYIWFDVSANAWNIRYSFDESATFGGVISTPGTIGQVYPVGLKINPDTISRLFQNMGNGQFTDVTDSAGLGWDFSNMRSAVFEDFDNDGDLDLYQVRTGELFNKPNKLYENDNQGHFADITSIAGAEALVEGRGESVAVADYNNDGFTDMLVLNGEGSAPFHFGRRVLLENQQTGNNWIQIKLVGNVSNRDGIGAVVSLETDILRLVRQQTGGMHCFSQNSPVLRFGLGNRQLIDKIKIHWPSGIIQQLAYIQVNQLLVIEEPCINLTLTPNALTIPQGGFLSVQVAITNDSDQAKSLQFATNVKKPNGQIYPTLPDWLAGPYDVILAPHETRTGILTHAIGGAPIGSYTYMGHAGNGPYDFWNMVQFDFMIIPPTIQGEIPGK